MGGGLRTVWDHKEGKRTAARGTGDDCFGELHIVACSAMPQLLSSQ